VGGFLVGPGDPGGVDLQGGGATAAVAEPARDGAQVDSGSDTGNQQCSDAVE
jgi:hypothetical protein